MTNLALRYRPRNFDDVVGQKAVSALLKAMVIKGTLPNVILLEGVKGGGKAQPLDALVLTPSGFVAMGSLKVGDSVADPSGEDSQVIGIYPQGIKQVYKLTFSDGTSCEATADHLWELERWKSRKISKTRKSRSVLEKEVRTTAEWADFITTATYKTQRARLVSTESLACFDMAEESLPVDPYLLGVLLGDGSLSSGVPTLETADDEILDAVEEALPEGVQVVFRMQGSASSSYALSQGSVGGRPNPLTVALREIGIWGCHSWDKFIPDSYKIASAKTRLAVLQGLMDTDGNWAKSGAQFSSCSVQLRDDVAWLARSLGMRVTTSSKETSYVYKDVKKKGRTAYRLSIRETSSTPRVFRLSRKLKNVPTSVYYRYLVSVEKLKEVECQCIKVSASSHLYVTNDFIPTHNTSISRILAASLNCSEDNKPCGECESCISIFEGRSMAVREIDASSHAL